VTHLPVRGAKAMTAAPAIGQRRPLSAPGDRWRVRVYRRDGGRVVPAGCADGTWPDIAALALALGVELFDERPLLWP
jgi:hypothetical protein